MKFSIVIPAHNESEYISRTIKSVLEQDCPRKDFEIIVVDNNSEDNTADIAKSAGADKVVRETDQGTNIARQRGVRESDGGVVAFLDADSRPPKNWLRKIESNLSVGGVVAVSGPYRYTSFKLRGALERNFYRIAPIFVDVLSSITRIHGAIIIGGNFAAWRWAIDKVGGLPPLRFWGDDAAIAMVLSRKAGEVIFDQTMTVQSSARRFKKTAPITLVLKYIWYYLKMFLKKY